MHQLIQALRQETSKLSIYIYIQFSIFDASVSKLALLEDLFGSDILFSACRIGQRLGRMKMHAKTYMGLYICVFHWLKALSLCP